MAALAAAAGCSSVAFERSRQACPQSQVRLALGAVGKMPTGQPAGRRRYPDGPLHPYFAGYSFVFPVRELNTAKLPLGRTVSFR